MRDLRYAKKKRSGTIDKSPLECLLSIPVRLRKDINSILARRAKPEKFSAILFNSKT